MLNLTYLYVDDFGLQIEIDVEMHREEMPSSVDLIVKNTDDSISNWNVDTYSVSGTVCKVYFTINENAIDNPGLYKIQPRLTLTNGTQSADPVNLCVRPKID